MMEDNKETKFYGLNEESCSHYEMEWQFPYVPSVTINRCKDCGYESWHYEDAHG